MTAPLFSVEHGVHTVAWGEPERVTLEFDLFHADVRKGETSAEASAFLTDPVNPRRLHRGRVTLTSSQSRSTFAKHLAGLAPQYGVDWPALINEAADLVLDAQRTGSPAILLRDAPIPDATGWILPPLVLARHPTIIFGDGGTGKSLIALAAGLSIETGRDDLLGLTPTATRRVAYLDWEFDAWEHRQRMSSLIGENMPGIVYVPCVGALRDQVDRLRRIFKEHDVGFAVIDSAGAACGGEPEAADVALTFFDAIRRLGVGTLVIAHTTKAGKDRDNRPFGSAFFHNMARATWLIKKEQETDASSFRVGLYNRKSNSGPLAGSMTFEISFTDDHTSIRRTAMSPALSTNLSLTQRIRFALKSGAMTYVELAEELDEEYASVKAKVHQGVGTLFSRWEGEDGHTRVGLLVYGSNGSQPTAIAAARVPTEQR